MLTDYIREAMRLAHYELMENGRFFATIPGLTGLWAEDDTLEACREELQSTLEDWIMIKARFGDKDFPVLGGMRLLGWIGPEAGKRHRVMRRGTHTVPIPNPHRGDLDWSLVKRVIKLANIDPDDWERLK